MKRENKRQPHSSNAECWPWIYTLCSEVVTSCTHQTEIKNWCKIFVSPWITTFQLSTTSRKALYMFIIDAIIEHTFGKTFNWWYGFSVCYSEEIRRLYTHIRIADIHLITPDELWCVIRGHNPYIAFIWHPCTSVCH